MWDKQRYAYGTNGSYPRTLEETSLGSVGFELGSHKNKKCHSHLPSELSYVDRLPTNTCPIHTGFLNLSFTVSQECLSTLPFTSVPEKRSLSIHLNTPNDESLILSHGSPFHCPLLPAIHEVLS